MNIEEIKKELREKLKNGSFQFKEAGVSLIEPQITGFESDLQVEPTNPVSDEYDNYSFSGDAQLKRVISGSFLTNPKHFEGSAKVTEGKKGEIVIEITKPITIR